MRTTAPALVALAFWASCAVPPPIAGAPCPCPSGFYCDTARDMCTAGQPPAPSADALPPPGQPDVEPAPPDEPIASCAAIGAPPPGRLTSTEYRFAVADLVDVTLGAAELPPEIDLGLGFATPSEDPTVIEAMRALAKTVATRARPKLQRPGFCAAGISDDACGQQYIDIFAQRAFRRPLDAVDRARLTEALSAGQRQDGLLGGMAAVIEATLASDNFLKRRDVVREGAAGPVAKLDAWSLATRMATLLWRSNPDELLLAAARSGSLLKAAERDQQALRMLRDPRAARMLSAFLRDWLDVDDQLLARPQTLVPAYTPAVRAALLRSFDGFADLLHQQDVPLATLFTTSQSLADRGLAGFYGLATPAGTGFEPVDPVGKQVRRGLLTAPAFLASLSNQLETNPVRRGRAFIEKILCGTLPPPPSSIDAQPPAINDKATTRQRFEMHRTNPACSSCHGTIDPIGFGLENYDGLGRWRTSESAGPINAGATVVAFGIIPGFSFQGPEELAGYLASAQQSQQCYVRQWFRYSFGRRETETDACTLDVLDKGFSGGESRTRALLLAIVRSDAFTSLTTTPGK